MAAVAAFALQESTRLRPLVDRFKRLFQKTNQHHYPVFGCRGEDVEIIQLPNDFHQILMVGALFYLVYDSDDSYASLLCL